MTDRIRATYENGVFKPMTPVDLPDGVPVVFVYERETSVVECPDPRDAAQRAANIASRAVEGDVDDPYVSENHDHYLYGGPKRRS